MSNRLPAKVPIISIRRKSIFEPSFVMIESVEERRRLLAKALMDLSEIIFAGIAIQFFVNPSPASIITLF